MVSALTGHVIDLESQQDPSQPPAGGSETHEMGILPGPLETRMSDGRGRGRRTRSASAHQGTNPEPMPPVSQDAEDLESWFSEARIYWSENDDATGHTPIQIREDASQAELPRSPVLDDLHVDVPPGHGHDQENEETRMIGDFNSSASALWSLYGREAKSHDESRIQTLKEDMDGVLIFAGLFSAALTAFIIDSKQNLKANPADQMVYYLKQNVVLLDQISKQISSIAPQVSIPSTPPSPFPNFNPLASDIRVNVFWFMALVFSLIAALLAILVQQWVRDYMHVFQRYSDPLKSARLRQYLNEGSEGWYMPVVAEAVPGLLHVGLFLFFVGLCDFTLNINTTIGLSTTIPIGISGFLYIFTIFAPIIYPQSPYQSSFSGVIWYLIQKIGARRYKDRGSDGALKSVDSNMADGQMQLAMEETDDRKGRDERAIRWLVSNMTEDAEMESFVMAIPGSFNGEWGVEVWKKVSNAIEDKHKSRSRNKLSRIQNVFGSIIYPVRSRTVSGPSVNTIPPFPAPFLPNVHQHGPHPTATHPAGENTMRELSARVAHMLETCKNHNLFVSDDLWRRRTRACVETTALLVCCAGAELGQFGDMVKLLGDIGNDQNIRESSLAGKDQSFLMRWTCLSLMAVRPILGSYRLVMYQARSTWKLLHRTANDETDDEQALTRVPKIIETFDKASRCLNEILCELIWDRTEERVKETLRKHESRISELERINTEDYMHQMVDLEIRYVQRDIDRRTHGIITCQLPGVKSDDFDTEPAHFSQLAELFCDPHKLQFIFPMRNLKRICSVAYTFRNILEGEWDPDAFQETLDNLQESTFLCKQHANMLHRQVWRLQDLGDGGGLGFTVQLFFVALKQLLSTSSPNESHSALYIGTFRAITSDWSKYKRSLGTQKLLLDMTVPDRGIFSDFDYPAYIVDEFLVLLGNILEGQGGPHIDDVEQLLSRRSRETFCSLRGFYTKALRVIIRVRVPSS